MNTFTHKKPVKITSYFILIFLFIPLSIILPQTIDDPIGDISISDPAYMDLKKVKFIQSTDIILMDFYPNDTIPKGNQAGINTSTIFEVYLDVDHDSLTGVRFGDIGYDYKLNVNINQWDGESWLIDGNCYWDFDKNGNPQSQESRGRFYVHKSYLTTTRFRWMFSLLCLDWTQVNWISRTYYQDHWTDQVPDYGYASLIIDPNIITEVDTVCGDYVMFIYPDYFRDEMDAYEILNAVDLGAKIESQVCGTVFNDIQRIEYSPCLQGVAWSGNPVLVGPSMWQGEPAWFIFFHELGHNYTLASTRFNQLYPGLGYISAGGDYWNFGTNFIEAWASLVGLYAIRELFTDQQSYQLGEVCRSDLENVYNKAKTSLTSYEENPDFSMLTPDLLDGIVLNLADSFGYEIIPRFFKILQPANESWDVLNDIDPVTDYDRSKTISMTVTCCAFSVAAGVDLREKFKTKWDFPIDDDLYESILPEVESMITGIDDDLKLVVNKQFELFTNYPNPFNANTVVSYQLKIPSPVKIKVYDLLGNVVRILYEGRKEAGYHRLVWNASDIASGIYMLSIETNQGLKTQKCAIIR